MAEKDARTTHGSGAATVVSPASSAVAPTVPSRWYICPANSGKAAAEVVRTKAFAAIADAAMAESFRFRWQSSYAATTFAGISLADLDGERVLGVTRTWLTTEQ